MKSHAEHEGMIHILAERIGDAPDVETPVHGAQSLQERLHSVYAPHENENAPSFAGAATRQGQLLEEMGEEMANLREAARDIGMALASLTLEATHSASETQARIESL